MAHTPGPWWTEDGESVVLAKASWRREGSGTTVAVVYDPEDGAHLTDVTVANARLIAAAPELLEVLTALVELRGQINYDSVIWNEARAAIAKAKQ